MGASEWEPPLSTFIMGQANLGVWTPEYFREAVRTLEPLHGQWPWMLQGWRWLQVQICWGCRPAQHGTVNRGLVRGIQTYQCFRNLLIHIIHQLGNALAKVAALSPSREFDCFVLAGAGSGGNGCPPEST